MATDKAVDTVELSCIGSEFCAADCIREFILGNCGPTFSISGIFTRLIRSYHEDLAVASKGVIDVVLGLVLCSSCIMHASVLAI